MKRAWPMTIAAILAGIAIAVAQNKVAPCLGVLQAAFGLDLSAVGWLSSVFSVMGILMACPAALFTNHLGPKNACVLSLVATIVGGVIGLISDSFPILLFSRIIEGMGASLIAVAVPTIIAVTFPPERRGLPTGLWSSWQFIAQALCFFFGVAITDAFGWQGVWWSGIVFALAAVILTLTILRLPKQKSFESAKPDIGSLGRTAGQRPVQAICFSMFCFCFSCFGFVTWAPTCWAETLHINLEQANWLISLFAIISIPAVVLVGWLIDRVSHRRVSVISCLGYGILVSAAFLMPNRAAMIPYTLFYPFFEGATSTSLWTIVPQTARWAQDTSSAIALFNMASSCGMLAGPPVAGAIIQAFGWRAMVLPLILAMSASALAAAQAKERVSGT